MWLSEITPADRAIVGDSACELAQVYNQKAAGELKILATFVIRADAINRLFQEQKIISKLKNALKDIHLHNQKSIVEGSKRAVAIIRRGEFSKALEKELFQALAKLNSSGHAKKNVLALQLSGSHDYYLASVTRSNFLAEIKNCMARWYAPDLIRAREQAGESHVDWQNSVVIQEGFEAVDSERGVIFTADPATRLDTILRIETAVKNNFCTLFKPGVRDNKAAIIEQSLRLNQPDIIRLAQAGLAVEDAFRQPQRIEWRRHGSTLYITSVHSLASFSKPVVQETFILQQTGKVIATGAAVGQQIAVGPVNIIKKSSNFTAISLGDIVIAGSIEAGMIPNLQYAAAIILEDEDTMSYPAMLARELGIPCVVGVEKIDKKFTAGQRVTVSCASGREAVVYDGALPFEVKQEQPEVTTTKTKIMLAADSTSAARGLSDAHSIPHDGVGLVAMDGIIKNVLAAHPLKLASQSSILASQKIAGALGYMAASVWPRPLTIQLSDANRIFFEKLSYGKAAEQKINLRKAARGAERYLTTRYEPVVAMECSALVRLRSEWGMTNIRLMAPFCRTPEEGSALLKLLAKHGVSREAGWSIGIAAQIPGNIMLAAEFATEFDALSINLDELTPLASGAFEKKLSAESKKIVDTIITDLVAAAHRLRKTVSVTGAVLQNDPQVLSLAIKRRVDSVIVDSKHFFLAQTAIAHAEKTVGTMPPGETNHRWLGMVAVFGVLAAGVMSVGAGCGLTTPRSVGTTWTPAQIRAEIQTMMREQQAVENQQAKSTAKVSGFADFTVAYPRLWSAEYAPDHLTIKGGNGTKDILTFFIHQKKYPVTPENMTSLTIGGRPALMFVDPNTVSTTPVTVYEIELANKKILEINSTLSANTLGAVHTDIINSLNFIN